MSEDRVYSVESVPPLSSKDNFSFEISELKKQYTYTLVNMNPDKDPRPFFYFINSYSYDSQIQNGALIL